MLAIYDTLLLSLDCSEYLNEVKFFSYTKSNKLSLQSSRTIKYVTGSFRGWFSPPYIRKEPFCEGYSRLNMTFLMQTQDVYVVGAKKIFTTSSEVYSYKTLHCKEKT